MKKCITKRMLELGYEQGIVRLELEELSCAETICKIGDNWFYFGGELAEELSPEEYVKAVPKEDLLQEIITVLEDFKTEFPDEYLYYYYYLKENIAETLKKGDRVRVNGDSKDLWIEDYNCNVDSLATVEKTPKKNAKKVLVNIDYIDHESNVMVYVKKSKLRR